MAGTVQIEERRGTDHIVPRYSRELQFVVVVINVCLVSSLGVMRLINFSLAMGNRSTIEDSSIIFVT